MSLEYEWMTNEEWVRFAGHQTTAIQFIGYGVLVVVIGLSWSFGAFNNFIVETPRGVTFVEGQLGAGVIHGSFMSAMGVVLLSFGHKFLEKASEVRLDAHWRKARGDAALEFVGIFTAVVQKALKQAVEGGEAND